MMLATLRALRALGQSAHIAELDERVIELEGVTEAEQTHLMPNGNRPRFNYFLSWARTYLKRAGYIENSARAVWSLTEAGERVDALQECQSAYEIVLSEERERSRLRRQAKRVSDPEASVQNETALHETEGGGGGNEDTQGSLELPAELPDWDGQLLNILKQMNPSAFERLAQRLLRESGFTKVAVRGQTGDGGIDGIGVLRVNLVSFQVYFQCKRWNGTVGAREIRDFRGALQGRADKGLFITTGTYSAQASDEATRDGATAIDLIDGDRLCELLKGLSLGVRTEMVEQVVVDVKWFDQI